MNKYNVVNSRANRVDGPAKATGRAQYIDDMNFNGQLYGALLQSPVAHAKIISIDTTKAKKLPGVKAIVTAKEAGDVKYGVSPARYDENIFCSDKVRYIGDEIAAVAAVDFETAQEAASLIKVEYKELPIILSIEKRHERKPGACT